MRFASVLLIVGLVTGSASAQGPTGRVFAPSSDDTHVSLAAPDTPYARADWLRSGMYQLGSRGAPNEVFRTFVRFPLPEQTQIVSATLRANFISSTLSSGPGVQLIDFVADDDWTEQTLTWNTQPPVTADRIATIPNGEASPFGEMSFDVTALAQREQAGDGVMSIRIAGLDETTRRAAQWYSRDNGHRRGFYLELVVSPAPRIEPGDAVTLSAYGLHTGIVAIDPERGVQKAIAPVRFVAPLGAIARDEHDGSWITNDGLGLVRFAPRTGGALTPIADADAVENERFMHLATHDGYAYASSQDRASSQEAAILRFDLATGARETLSLGPPLCLPSGMVIVGTDLIVADRCSSLIRVPLAGGAASVIATALPLDQPDGIAVGEDGFVLVADATDESHGRIVRVDLATGATETIASLPFEPGPIAFDPSRGVIWAGTRALCSWWQSAGCSRLDTQVGRVDPTLGSYTQVAQWTLDLGGLLLDRDGAPIVTLSQYDRNTRIVRVDPVSGATRTVAAPLPLPLSSSGWEHRHIFYDSKGRLLAVSDDRIVRVDPVTGQQSMVALDPPFACEYPSCLTMDAALGPDGRIALLRWLPLDMRKFVVKFDPSTGAIQSYELEPWVQDADAIAIEPSGALLLGDSNATFGSPSSYSRIDRLDFSTASLTPVASGLPLAVMRDMVIHPSGAILVGQDPNEILRVDPASGAVEPVIAGAFEPERMAVDASGRVFAWGGSYPEFLAVADPASGRIAMLATEQEFTGYRTVAVFEPACANGRDDDRDGRIDLADAGCADAAGRREDPQCDNGLDDDGDGLVDLADPSCASASGEERKCGLGGELLVLIGSLRLAAARAKRRRSTLRS